MRKVTWVGDLGAPKQPGVYEVRELQVQVRASDIQRAEVALKIGCSDVVFNLIASDVGGLRRHVLGEIATD